MEAKLSLERADARFLFSERARSVAVLGDLPGWREAFDGHVGEQPDLVVAPGERLHEAIRLEPRVILLEGGSGLRPPRARGWQATDYLALPHVALPDLLIPSDARDALRYALA